MVFDGVEGRAVIAVSLPHKLLSAAHEWREHHAADYPSMSSLLSRALAEKIGFLSHKRIKGGGHSLELR